VYRRRYESRRSRKPCIRKTKKNTAKNDFQYGGWNSSTLQCGTWLWDDMTLSSLDGSTVQSGKWYDMPLNLPKRPPYCNFTSGFNSTVSRQSACHTAPVCKISFKSDRPRQKNDVVSIFKMVDLAFYGPNNGFFEKHMYDFL